MIARMSVTEADRPALNGTLKREVGVTFASQAKLQKLPIPELEDTCNKYLAAVKPLQTKREHRETVKAVQEFLRTDGPVLQEKLKRYAADKASYIEQFCMFYL
jgi:carnitine O-acetyltransferase